MTPIQSSEAAVTDALFRDFLNKVQIKTDLSEWPLAQSTEQNLLCYDGKQVEELCTSPADRDTLKNEWCRALSSGPGVIAIKSAFASTASIDRATDLFSQIIEEEKSHSSGGDHFAKPGANDRVWNAVQKHCLRDPENFASYYANESIALVCEAWLGDGYQLTAQINRVNPGGAAQVPHRDYHLGFMPLERMQKFPAHVHSLSPALTLQGAVAHCDMPLETGPTRYLPYSQLFVHGYTHFNQSEYQKYYKQHHAQLPLKKGDAAFFNPAVMHGAGSNTTRDQYRMANLLQVSSAFGRAMEAVDRTAMVKALYPVLLNTDSARHTKVIAASAEGYAFPTNLDTDPPVGGMSPATQADLMTQALKENWPVKKFNDAIDEQFAKTRH